MERLNLEIVSPAGIILNDVVDEVSAPGSQGELSFLPGHRPLLAPLVPGPLRIRRGWILDYYSIGGGFIEVYEDRIIIVADTAEAGALVDVDRAQRARQRAQAQLEQIPMEEEEERERQESALKRALARLHAAAGARSSDAGQSPHSHLDDD